MPTDPRPSNLPTASITPRIATPFVPPAGFSHSPLSQDAHAAASRLLKDFALEGKQLYYISAPASLPIKSIQGISLAAVKQGNARFEHGGTTYSVVEDSSCARDRSHLGVLVPQPAKKGYLTSKCCLNLPTRGSNLADRSLICSLGKRAIDCVMHIQHSLDTPVLDGPHAVKSAALPVRDQPDGLKMRFAPFGFEPPRTALVTRHKEAVDVEESPRKKVKKSSHRSGTITSGEKHTTLNDGGKGRKKDKKPRL